MAEFEKRKLLPEDINRGQKVDGNSGLSPTEFNAMVEGILYAQENGGGGDSQSFRRFNIKQQYGGGNIDLTIDVRLEDMNATVGSVGDLLSASPTLSNFSGSVVGVDWEATVTDIRFMDNYIMVVTDKVDEYISGGKVIYAIGDYFQEIILCGGISGGATSSVSITILTNNLNSNIIEISQLKEYATRSQSLWFAKSKDTVWSMSIQDTFADYYSDETPAYLSIKSANTSSISVSGVLITEKSTDETDKTLSVEGMPADGKATGDAIEKVRGEIVAGVTIKETTLVGEDENGGNIYKQTFSNGYEAQFVAPKGAQGKQGERGEQGEQGIQGENAVTLTIGTVVSGDVAKVENVGTPTNPILNFTLPRGEKGAVGGLLYRHLIGFKIFTRVANAPTNQVATCEIISEKETAYSYDELYEYLEQNGCVDEGENSFISIKSLYPLNAVSSTMANCGLASRLSPKSIGIFHNVSVDTNKNVLTGSLSVVHSSPAEGDIVMYYISEPSAINEGEGSTPLTDVQINGTSIVTDGVADIPIAGINKLGLISSSSSAKGLYIDEKGSGYIVKATDTEILNKTQIYRPITPSTLDYAVKVGVTTNTIELTDGEKEAAQEWLGITGGTLYLHKIVIRASDSIKNYQFEFQITSTKADAYTLSDFDIMTGSAVALMPYCYRVVGDEGYKIASALEIILDENNEWLMSWAYDGQLLENSVVSASPTLTDTVIQL